MAKFTNELNNYQNIPRDLVFDITISDRARFVYCFMACKPNDWDFYLEPMAKEIGYSVDTLRKYINELVESGWLEKGEQEREKGTFGAVSYTLKATKNTDTEKYRYGENPTQHNIDYKQKIDGINKEKEDNKLSSKKKASNTAWRANFVEYKVLVETAKEELLNDEEFKYKFISMYPNADFYRTVLKSMDYWCSEQGWNTKKKSKSKEINMLATLKKNLDKSVVYKNHNDEPIENLRKLSIEYTDKKEGTLADGTIIKGAYRYYFSNRDGRAYSIPIEAPPMPNDRCEFDIKTNSWQMPKENETLSDNIW